MKRLVMGLFATGSIVLIGACASAGFNEVAVTTDPNLVSTCQKLDTVSVDATVEDEVVDRELTQAARSKGANYLLVSGEGVREGTAYRCQVPATTGGGN